MKSFCFFVYQWCSTVYQNAFRWVSNFLFSRISKDKNKRVKYNNKFIWLTRVSKYSISWWPTEVESVVLILMAEGAFHMMLELFAVRMYGAEGLVIKLGQKKIRLLFLYSCRQVEEQINYFIIFWYGSMLFGEVTRWFAVAKYYGPPRNCTELVLDLLRQR